MQIGLDSLLSCPKDTLEFAARECVTNASPRLGAGSMKPALGQRLDDRLAAVAIAPKPFQCVSFRIVEEKELVGFWLAPRPRAATHQRQPRPSSTCLYWRVTDEDTWAGQLVAVGS